MNLNEPYMAGTDPKDPLAVPCGFAERFVQISAYAVHFWDTRRDTELSFVFAFALD
jgi:hypothetical protein